MGKAGLEPINPRRIEGPPRPMQPKSSQKVKRVACVLKRSVERQLKRGKLAERVAYNLRFSLIRLNYKAKMQLYEAKQAKRVVAEPINRFRMVDWRQRLTTVSSVSGKALMNSLSCVGTNTWV